MGIVSSEIDTQVLGESFLGTSIRDESMQDIFYDKDSDLIGPSVVLSFSGRFWTAVQLKQLYVRLLMIENELLRSEKITVLRKYLSQGEHKYKQLTPEGFAVMTFFMENDIHPYWFIDFPGWLLFADSINSFDVEGDLDFLITHFIDDKIISSNKSIQQNKLLTKKDADWALAVKKNYSKNYFAFLFFRPKPSQASSFSLVAKLLGLAGLGVFGYRYNKFRNSIVGVKSRQVFADHQKAVIEENSFLCGPSVALYRLQEARITKQANSESGYFFPVSVQASGALNPIEVSANNGIENQYVILPAGYHSNNDLAVFHGSDADLGAISSGLSGSTFRIVSRYSPKVERDSAGVAVTVCDPKTTQVYSGGDFWTIDQIAELLKKIEKDPTFLDAYVGSFFPGVSLAEMDQTTKKTRFKNFINLMFPQLCFPGLRERELSILKKFTYFDYCQRELPAIFGSGSDSNSLFIWFKRWSWWVNKGKDFIVDQYPQGLFEENQAPLVSYVDAYERFCNMMHFLGESSCPALRSKKFEDFFTKPAVLHDDRFKASRRFGGKEFVSANSIQTTVFGPSVPSLMFEADGFMTEPATFAPHDQAERNADDFVIDDTPEAKERMAGAAFLRNAGLSVFPYFAQLPVSDCFDMQISTDHLGGDTVQQQSRRLYVKSPLRHGDQEPIRRLKRNVLFDDELYQLGFIEGSCQFVGMENPQVGDTFVWKMHTNSDGTLVRKLRLAGIDERCREEGDILLSKINSIEATVCWKKDLAVSEEAGVSGRYAAQAIQALRNVTSGNVLLSMNAFFDCLSAHEMNASYCDVYVKIVSKLEAQSDTERVWVPTGELKLGDTCRIKVSIRSADSAAVGREITARLRSAGRLKE